MEPQQTPPEQEPVSPQPIQPAAQPESENPSEPAVRPIRLHKSSGSIEAITEPGEVLIFRVKKHLFGILVMYLQVLLGFGLAGGLVYFLLPSMVGADQQANVRSLMTLILILVAGLLGLIMVVVTYIYRQNELILTDRNVTQIIKNSLFSRQVSQLTLNNIEDVTADKEGLWSMVFNFGQIRIETAGEQNNFHFTYCPNPNHYGQLLVDTRAKCVGRGGNIPPH